MKVVCEQCKKEIRTENIDLDKGIAKCTSCNKLFDCRDQVQATIDYRRDTIKLPRSIKLTREKNRLVIEFRWLAIQTLYLAPFCLCWDASFFLWYRIGFISSENVPSLLYLLFHIVSGIALTYYVIAGILNRTIISVSGGAMQITDTPLTFFRNASISLEELDQLYARQKVHRGKKLSWSSYEVHAILKPEKNIRLVAGLNTSEQALYIEQVVEDYLGIRDRPVEGEIAR